MISFTRTTSANAIFRELVVLLDRDLKHRDGADNAFYDQFNSIEKLDHVIVCRFNENAVGCGAFKVFDQDSVEIKRMYVLPAYRGQHLGLLILEELEQWAAEQGFSKSILETGKKQPEAIHLYQKAGYKIIRNYGPYANIDNSICFYKMIR